MVAVGFTTADLSISMFVSKIFNEKMYRWTFLKFHKMIKHYKIKNMIQFWWIQVKDQEKEFI